MSTYLYASSAKNYTPETHPWKGRVVLGWPPGTYYLDGKPYCPTAWILSSADKKKPETLAVQNTKAACEDVVKQWVGRIEWQEANAASEARSQ